MLPLDVVTLSRDGAGGVERRHLHMFRTMKMDQEELLRIAARGGPYLIDGRVARSGVTAVSAETGVGKSLWCLGAALGLAAGYQRIYGREVWSPRPRNVLYVDAENPESAAASRGAAWMAKNACGGLPQFVYHQEPAMVLRGVERDEREEEAPAVAFAEGRSKLREELGDPEAEFDVIFLDNLATLRYLEDGNNAAQSQRAIRAAQKMGECGRQKVPVVLAVHPSQGGGLVNRTLLQRGAPPEPAHAISGAMTTAQACEAIICLARDAADPERLLLGTAKMRSAQRDPKVWQSTPELVDLALPAWTDEDGKEHPPRTQSGVPVLGDSWEVRGKTSSAAHGLVEWMGEAGLVGRPHAIALKAAAALDGCPVSEKTLRNYHGGTSAAVIEAKNLGFRSDLGDAPERGGLPPILLWVASAEELAVEDAGEGGSQRARATNSTTPRPGTGSTICWRC